MTGVSNQFRLFIALCLGAREYMLNKTAVNNVALKMLLY